MISTFVLDDAAIAALAADLRSRLTAPAGSLVASICGNSPLAVAARDAARDHLYAPLNPKLAPAELRELLDTYRPVALVRDSASPTWDSISRPTWDFRPDQLSHVGLVGTLLFTSGTGGRPKGCVRTPDQDAARLDELTASYALTPDDVHLIACPLAHSAPSIFLRACRRAGARTVIQSGFDARAFGHAVTDHRATVFFLVPTQWHRILELPEAERGDWSSVRCAVVAGAPIAPDTKRRILDWLGPRLWEFYGSSETGTITTIGPDDHLAHPSSVGRPPAGVTVTLRDESGAAVPEGELGEVFVRSPAIMAGYLEGGVVAPAPAEVSVGDLGRMHDGWLTLVDRKHDTIISGGVNVYPAAVERALARHPAIAGAVAFGVDDPDWGQRVAAVIAVRDAPPSDLKAFLREHLSGPELPRLVAYCTLDELPIGGSGKVLRRLARASFAARLAPL